MQLTPGSRLAHYQIVSLLGRGGMGEVYRATDTRLGRDVALKVLPPDVAYERMHLQRFEREAKSLAALDHPGIVTVFSVEQDGGTHFLTMQLVPGQTLREVIPAEGLSSERILELAIPLADALAAAHEKDIIHRDIKPGNVMVTAEGNVKILDFGLSRRLETISISRDDPTRVREDLTERGVVVGTMPYMSPEQIEGRTIGPESDVFSLGVVLYEMATGRRPFQGATAPALMSSILRESPPPLSEARAGVSKELGALVARCLEKDPSQRLSAADLRRQLAQLRETSHRPLPAQFTRPWIPISLSVVITIVSITAWIAVTRSRRVAFVAESLPRMERLAQQLKFAEAFALANEIEDAAGANVITGEIRDSFSLALPVESDPPGAAVSYRPFGSDAAWTALGAAPLKSVRVPRGPLHWRAELPGYLRSDFITNYPGKSIRITLPKADASNRDMVLVPATEVDLWTLGTVKPVRHIKLGSFFIDRGEVTNRQFANFIAAGGYSRPEFWKHAFRDGDRTLTFEEAMDRFKDATGRPGPASWRVSSFPDGEGEFPVHGVSWYEAAAFAAFAGKELPTVYHWYQADTAGDLQLLPGLITPKGNYESTAPRPMSAARVLGAHGVVDMGGNVREWSANASESNSRIVLGGAWSDPSYLYMLPESRNPFDRSIGNGFRCIRRTTGEVLPEGARAALPGKARIDNINRRPVSDEMFEVFTRMYDRVPVELQARVESTDQTSQHWIKQKVSYTAGYGGERMSAWLYLPRSATPPYQVMIVMAGASTFIASKSSAKESEIFGWGFAESLIRAGRAVMIPIWKGSYERQDGFHPFESEKSVYRDHLIRWVSELRQSVDYLESRNDIDKAAIGFEGISFGSMWAPVFLTLEPRLRTGILLLTGFRVARLTVDEHPPELDPFHYAPRVKTPVLIMSGRYDPIYPYETSQLPLFRSLGTPAEKKRHLTYPGGHSSYGWRDQLDRETLDWLDSQFGKVASAPAATASSN